MFFFASKFFFGVFNSFSCVDIKNNFLKIKNIILIYLLVNNTLKNNHNHLKVWFVIVEIIFCCYYSF
jgi:hypothetical protein